MKGSFRVVCLLAGLMAVSGGGSRLWADDPAKFDLVGPKVDVRVKRGSVTLPIAQVPNLMAEDKIWVKVDLPSTFYCHPGKAGDLPFVIRSAR